MTLAGTLTLGIVALVCSAAVSATTRWQRCDFCVTQTAPQQSAYTGHVGPVVVYSLVNQWALKFNNQFQVVGEGCQPLRSGVKAAELPAAKIGCRNELSALPSTLNAFDTQFVKQLQSAFTETGGRMKTNYAVQANLLRDGGNAPILGPVTQEPFGSAHDYVNNANFSAETRKASLRALKGMGTAMSKLFETLSSKVGITYASDDFKINLTLVYEDGSSVVLNFDPDVRFPTMVGAKDAENRDIPTRDTLNQFRSNNHFNGDRSLENFVRNLEWHGVSVTRSVANPVRVVSCRPIPNGISCTRSR